MLNLGNKLKVLRTQKMLTQEQVAIRLGITKAMISAYELGTRYPSLEMLVKLAQSYNVSTDYLLGLNKEKSLDISNLTNEQLAVISSIITQFQAKHPSITNIIQ